MSDYSDGVEPGEADPRLDEPGSQGAPGSLDDSAENLPGSQKDPIMENSKIDPDAPISSAKGNV